MDKRSLLALFLIFVVIVGGTMLRQVIAPPPPPMVDTVAIDTTGRDSTRVTAPATPTVAAQPDAPRASATTASNTPAAVVPAETTTVTAPGRALHFSTLGAHPTSVTLTEYEDLVADSGAVRLAATTGPLLRYRVVNGAQTIRLDQVVFTKTVTPSGVEFVSTNPQLRVRYETDSTNYMTHVSVSMPGADPNASIQIDLAENLTSGEADVVEDIRNLAYSYRPVNADVESASLSTLDAAQPTVVSTPLEWVAVRNKYFLLAVMTTDSTRAMSGISMRGGEKPVAGSTNQRPTGVATATLPLRNGEASFDIYTGPQSWKTLRAVGHELSNVNPYGWAWIRPVVEPFATIVMRALLGMKAMIGLSYGWVLVIFGILVRLLLWPLNQTAMRSSMKLQAMQPEMQAIQKRYSKDPEALRTAMMKLYAEHGTTPFAPLLGCLPMMLPMPILMALYFVFQNTIEFRGVPFLWLPDISMMDPYFITPITMGLTMLAMSLIGLRVGPPNPQAKVMAYTMPVMFTFFFWKLAAGLNLYYAVQNLVGIPQQWLLTRERLKASNTPVVKGPPATKQRK